MQHAEEGQGISVRQIEELFHAKYETLCMIAVRYVGELELAKDLVQEFFVYVWNKRNQIQLKSSFEAYAVRSVKNICVTYIKRHRDLIVYQDGNLPEIAFDPDGTINDEQLKAKIYSKLTEALELLPTERRKLFLMSNVQGLTYAEIAKRNNISVNTVKTQIKKAYATLRSQLSENLFVSFLLFS
ncbi:ECF RNA polymerase sigma factor SigE [compost metagenome]